MEGVIITSTENYIKIDYNDYYPNPYPATVGYYNRSTIEKVKIYPNVVVVHILENTRDWELSYDGSEGFKVKSIDGVVPTDLADLGSKLALLMKA